MSEKRWTYETEIHWDEARRGTVRAGERLPIGVGAPPEFGGTATVWSPEHLAVAAVNSCFMLTFVAVAEASRIPFLSYTSSAAGTLEKGPDGITALTRICVRPRIEVSDSIDRERVERVLRLAERNCFISNSMRSEVSYEPEIVTGGKAEAE